MKPRKKRESFSLSLLLPLLLVVIDLLLLWHVKYHLHGMSYKDFRISFIGNIFNLIISSLIFLGVIIVYFLKKEKKYKHLVVYSILMTSFLVLGIISAYGYFPFSKNYLLGHPFPEVITDFFFSAFQFIQFMFLSTIWINIFGGRELVIVKASVQAVFIVILFLLFSFFYLHRSNLNDKISSKQNNVAVVFGAAVWSKNIPSPTLAGRVDKAADLYKSGIASKIQLTGGKAPGELTEAEVSLQRLKDKNIDTSDIWLEEKTSSTNEQVRFIKENLIKDKKLSKIILVSDSFHLIRIREICRFFNVQADLQPSGLNLSFDKKIYYKMRESVALLIFWFFAL
jgi:uncharacterized SAM-binding protein YcdF (DUF218 family)